MLINELKIQAFRGIRDTVDLQFDKPLTVIYAPNGTGKTSICDAVEWLLTDRVSRLVKQREDVPDYQCKLADSDTYVECDIQARKVGNRFLKREFGKNLKIRLQPTDKWTAVNNTNLLPMLIPDITFSKTPYGLDWLRSTHFIESHSLDLLIDNDDPSQERRKLLFSDLFGVKEQQDEITKIESVLRSLTQADSIRSQIAKITGQIESLEKTLTTGKKKQSAPIYEALFTLVKKMAAVLEVETDSYTNAKEGYYDLRNELKEFEADIRYDAETLETINKEWAKYLQFSTDLPKKKKEAAEKEKLLKKLEKDTEAKKKQVTEQHAAMEQEEKVIKEHEATLAEIQDDMNSLSRLVAELKKLFQCDDSELGSYLKKIENNRASAEIKFADVLQRIKQLQDAQEKMPTWQQARKEQKDIDNQKQFTRKLLEKDDVLLSKRKEKQEIESKLRDLSYQRQELHSEVTSLLSQGIHYIESHEGEKHCPLCAYEYQSHEELLKRANSRLGAYSQTSQEEGKLQATLRTLTDELKKQDEFLTELNRLEKESQKHRKLLEEAEKILKVVLPDHPKILDAPNSLDVFRALLDKLRQEQNLLQLELSKFTIKQKLEEIQERTAYIKRHYKLSVSELTVPSLPDWKLLLSEMYGILSKKLTEVRKSHELKQKSCQETEEKFAQLSEQQKSQETEVSKFNDTCVSYKQFIDNVNALWAAISEDSLSEENLTAYKKEHEGDVKQLNALNKQQEEGDKLLKEAKQAEKEEAEVKQIQSDIEEKKKEKKLKEDLLKFRNGLEEDVNALQEGIQKFISDQLSPLRDVISTLYLRAQGNQFISSIEAAPNDMGSLEWIARLGEKDGEELKSTRSLSQGQRQDLALAIFLARARARGGTYFLDEPLLHLDDLNRISLLDTLRLIATEEPIHSDFPLRLVMTTANLQLVHHLREKFSLIRSHPLKIYHLEGNPKIGTKAWQEDMLKTA